MPTMLIADDNEQITRILSQFAKHEGFAVDTVYDGEAALNTTFDLCKDFYLTDTASDTKSDSTCGS